MKNNGRCLNYNHGRPDAPVRFCPMCGEEKYKGTRRETNTYCVDCGEQLIQ